MSSAYTPASLLPLLKQVVIALGEKKAGDLCVLDVTGKSTITDYIVLATGNSEPHLRALRIEVEKALDAVKAPIAGMDEGNYGSGWTVVDAYQIMVHVFTEEQRANYRMEKLWKDAKVIDVAKLIAEPKPAPAPKAAKPKAKAKAPAAKKAPAKKKALVAKKAAVKKPVTTKKTAATKKAVSKATAGKKRAK